MERETIEFREDKVFYVKRRPLNERMIRSRITRIRNKIRTIERDSTRLSNVLNEKNRQIEMLQEQLRSLTSPEVEEYIRRERDLKQAILNRSLDLLREYLGEEAFAVLESKGFILFQDERGQSYKVNARGRVFKKDQFDHYRELCVIRPNLPVPDIVISVMTAVRNDPSRFRNFRR